MGFIIENPEESKYNKPNKTETEKQFLKRTAYIALVLCAVNSFNDAI